MYYIWCVMTGLYSLVYFTSINHYTRYWTSQYHELFMYLCILTCSTSSGIIQPKKVYGIKYIWIWIYPFGHQSLSINLKSKQSKGCLILMIHLITTRARTHAHTHTHPMIKFQFYDVIIWQTRQNWVEFSFEVLLLTELQMKTGGCCTLNEQYKTKLKN
jgi:hypothetical protein